MRGWTPMGLPVSAVICTHNQAQWLGEAIESLVDQTLAKDAYEIIVVDNASSDSTRTVVGKFLDRDNFHYIFEPRIGLSYARNTGWQSAKGQIIAYIDSDAVASSDWLEKMLQCYQNISPTPICVGGRILPLWDAPRPKWLSKSMEPYVGIIDWSEGAGTIEEKGPYLAGSNVSYQRWILNHQQGFNPALGRKGRILLSNEEILLQYRIRAQGYHIWYDPQILVMHHVKKSCLTINWFYKRYYWQGISDIILDFQMQARPTGTKNLLPYLVTDIWGLLRATGHLFRRASVEPRRHVLHKCLMLQFLGRIRANIMMNIRGKPI